MSRNAWQETIEQTQIVIRQHSDRCFVCGQSVAVDAPDALIQAYLDEGHEQRLAAVCGRAACRKELEDPHKPTWQRLFDALTHWPDSAIHPHGPYWIIHGCRAARSTRRAAEDARRQGLREAGGWRPGVHHRRRDQAGRVAALLSTHPVVVTS